jgi:chitinase
MLDDLADIMKIMEKVQFDGLDIDIDLYENIPDRVKSHVTLQVAISR